MAWDPPASSSCVLGLNVCAATKQHIPYFIKEYGSISLTHNLKEGAFGPIYIFSGEQSFITELYPPSPSSPTALSCDLGSHLSGPSWALPRQPKSLPHCSIAGAQQTFHDTCCRWAWSGSQHFHAPGDHTLTETEWHFEGDGQSQGRAMVFTCVRQTKKALLAMSLMATVADDSEPEELLVPIIPPSTILTTLSLLFIPGTQENTNSPVSLAIRLKAVWLVSVMISSPFFFFFNFKI